MAIMVDAEYLTNDEFIRGGAAELFLKHRDEVITEKALENPGYDALPKQDLIRDKTEFPTFHVNWIQGIVTSCLKILNHVGAVASDLTPPIAPPTPPVQPGPIFDPIVAFDYVSKIAPAAAIIKPSADINSIIKYFALPGKEAGGEQQAAIDMGLIYPAPPNDVAMSTRVEAFKAAMATITSAAKYEKRIPENFIPDIPSEDFPNLDYGQSELSIKSKQELLFTGVVNAFDDLVTLIKATPLIYLFPISTGVSPASEKPATGQQLPGPGLLPIFNAAKLALDARLPDPSAAANDAISNIANFEALKRFLIKPLYLAAVGVVFGSHPEGFVGLMGNVVPDAVKEFNNNFKDPTPARLTSEQEAQNIAAVNQSEIIDDVDDAQRNNVPVKRNRLVVSNRYLGVGSGLKNEIYRRFKEIGSRFISSGPTNKNADDNHKGLTVMCVLYHETSMDPGAGNRFVGGKYIGYDPNEWEKTTDALIWAGNIALPGKATTSMTKKQFQSSPIMDPQGSDIEKGMDLMLQLEFYEEFLTRQCAVLGAKFIGTTELLMSGGRRGVVVSEYRGPDPHVENNLFGPLRHYLDDRNGEGTDINPKQAGQNLKKLLPPELGGEPPKKGIAAGHKGFQAPRYYIQSPYDIYGFHQGVKGAGDTFVRSQVNDDAEKKHVILYTMAVRNIQGMIVANEHVPRYMKAVGMSSIDWDMVGVVGFKKYVDDQGQYLGKFPTKPSFWYQENISEIKELIQTYNDRANLK